MFLTFDLRRRETPPAKQEKRLTHGPIGGPTTSRSVTPGDRDHELRASKRPSYAVASTKRAR